MEKQCNKCNLSLQLTEFRKGRVCISCERKHHRDLYQKNREERKSQTKKYREENSDKVKSYYKKKYLQNSEVLINKSKDYYNKNRDKCLTKVTDYRNKNRELINEKRRSKKYHLSPAAKIKNSLHNRLYKIIKYKKLRLHNRAVKFLGCTVNELILHLESKFLPTMTWENHGALWHIDHVIPCAHFDLTKEEDQQKCFYYTNLQPLFAITTTINNITYIGNLNKKDKLI
jgi:hypothetical protein